ncbi:MAG: MFS family permease [Pseudomonadales bacterium]|jgi:MFS family permease
MSEILNRNVVVLMLCQILAFSASFSLMLVGGLIGTELSGSERLGTLPIAAMVIGTAVGVAPVILLMKKFGRKPVFVAAASLGVVASLLIIYALNQQSFSYFCAGSALLGVFLASVQQYRFAAMESVSLDQAPTAASMLLLAGVAAAVIGPELVLWGKALTTVDYEGSYYVVAVCILLSISLMTLYQSIESSEKVVIKGGRPLSKLLSLSPLWLALLSAAIGYAVMSLVMTATPVSMHNHFHHSLEDTKWVLQSHVMAMFLPSLFAPWIISHIGIHGLIATGLVAMFAALIVSSQYFSVDGFWLSLVLLGIGWNFMFVGGTSLLPLVYRDGEQFTVQALNDGVVFSIQALASSSSGWILAAWQWQGVVLASIPLLLMPLCLLLWVRFSGK